MWGQGQLKGEDMIMRDPDEKGENFKICYFCHKKLSLDAKFDGGFNGDIFVFLYCIIWSKNEFENFTYIFEASGRNESYFRIDWLEIWHMYSLYMHNTHAVRFFNSNFLNFNRVFFSTFDFLKI